MASPMADFLTSQKTIQQVLSQIQQDSSLPRIYYLLEPLLIGGEAKPNDLLSILEALVRKLGNEKALYHLYWSLKSTSNGSVAEKYLKDIDPSSPLSDDWNPDDPSVLLRFLMTRIDMYPQFSSHDPLLYEHYVSSVVLVYPQLGHSSSFPCDNYSKRLNLYRLMEEKGFISPTSIEALTKILESLELKKLRAEIEEEFSLLQLKKTLCFIHSKIKHNSTLPRVYYILQKLFTEEVKKDNLLSMYESLRMRDLNGTDPLWYLLWVLKGTQNEYLANEYLRPLIADPPPPDWSPTNPSLLLRMIIVSIDTSEAFRDPMVFKSFVRSVSACNEYIGSLSNYPHNKVDLRMDLYRHLEESSVISTNNIEPLPSILHNLGLIALKEKVVEAFTCHLEGLHKVQTGLSVCAIVSLPDDVHQYAHKMRQLYKHQPDVAKDWPPTVGKDFYGRLVLIEQDEDAMITDEAEIKNSSWYLLRGKVDKIVEMSENKEIDAKDVLQPTDGLLSLRVIIDGPPGIGKTTLCYKLLKMWSEGTLLHNHYDLVLYCPLRNSKIAAATTLADLFMTESSKVSSVVKWISDRDGDGLLIIFDGWDELSSQLRESSLVASIISREKFDQCSVIVTSRTYASSSLLDVTPLNRRIQVIGFAEDELSTVIIRTLQKDEKMAQELIDKKKEDDRNGQPFTTTHSSKGSQLAANLINDLKVRGDVQSLCYVPLVCSMVILVYRKKQGHLPTTLSELYENFILQTIRRHAKLRNVDPYILGNLSSLPSQFATAFKEMCRIAYANLANTKVAHAFSTYELLEQLLSETVIDENYLGLITTFMEYDEKKHQFIHLSIQEFLAAWWIAKHEEKTEDVFKKHFDNEHFRMCLRFVAGLTHLEHESYQQYFKREQLKLLAQCKRDRMNGFQMSCFSPFNQNYQIRARHVRYDNYDNFPILLLQLLYESQNTTLCQVLAQSINNSSICLEEISLSFFDWLCLSYFINNSRMTWNHLHLGLVHAQPLSILTKGLTNMSNDAKCKRLEVHLRNGELLQKLLQQSFLRIIQECYCSLEGDLCTALLLLLNLPQLKVLHLVIEFSFTAAAESAYPEKCSKLEKCIEMNSTLQEMNIEYEECSDSQISNTIAVVMRGVTQNRAITSLTMNIASVDDCPFSPLPDGAIEHLLKNNSTLKALSLNIPNKLLPSSLSVVEVNTPLTALNIGKLSSSLMTSLLPHIKELHCLILPKPYPPHLLFHSHPNLQTLYLPLDTTDGAIELFTALQKNNTLKALRVWMERKGENTEEMYTSSMGASLEDMLTQNKILKYLEINRHNIPLPSSFLTFLTAGMRRNISLQQISIPLIINEDIRTFFDVISQKSILTELDVSFSDSIHSNNTDQENRKIVTPLFFKQALPAVTEMLQSHKTMELLRIWCPLSNDSPQPEWRRLVKRFYEAIYIHPSLVFFSIMIGYQDNAHFMEDVHKKKEKAWTEKRKQEQPNKPVPIIKFVKY